MADNLEDAVLIGGIFTAMWAFIRGRRKVAEAAQATAAAAPATPPVVGGFEVAPGFENPFGADPFGLGQSAPYTSDFVNSFFGIGGGQAAAPAVIPDVLTLADTRVLASNIISRYFGNRIDLAMVTAMVEIESGFRRKAYRYEAHISDASYGLMQVLFRTAKWLRDDMRYNAFPLESGEAMYDPAVGIYFGCAYIDWLRKQPLAAKGEDFVVMAYNGGPGKGGQGTDIPMTRNHLSKYHAAKSRQSQVK